MQYIKPWKECLYARRIAKKINGSCFAFSREVLNASIYPSHPLEWSITFQVLEASSHATPLLLGAADAQHPCLASFYRGSRHRLAIVARFCERVHVLFISWRCSPLSHRLMNYFIRSYTPRVQHATMSNPNRTRLEICCGFTFNGDKLLCLTDGFLRNVYTVGLAGFRRDIEKFYCWGIVDWILIRARFQTVCSKGSTILNIFRLKLSWD